MQGRNRKSNNAYTYDLVSDDEEEVTQASNLNRANLEGDDRPTKRRKLFKGILADEDSTYDLETVLYEVNEKKARKFEALSLEAQQQCIRAISRLFLFRGSKREVITRGQLLEYLGKIDLEYKAHCDVVLEKVQEVLLGSTGYLIVDGASIRGCNSGSKNDYYLVNTLNKHENLQQILSWHWAEEGQGTATMTAVGKSSAFSAFALIVFHSIFNSPAYTILCKDLLRNLRKVDSRFPESLPSHSSKSSATSAPIRELEEDFLSLLSRLKKVRRESEASPFLTAG